MSWGRSIALVIGAVAVVSMSGDALGAEDGGRSIRTVAPRTVAVVVGEANDFAATDTHAGWIDYAPNCNKRRLHLLSFRSSRPRTLRIRLCQRFVAYGPLAIDHGRAVWKAESGGNTEFSGRVSIAAPGDRAATTLRSYKGTDLDADPQVSLASDRAGALFTLWGSVFRVVGRRPRLLFDGSTTSALDVAGNRVGVIRAEILEDVEQPHKPPRAELRDRRTGKLLVDFELSREGGIAVSANTIALWDFDYATEHLVLDCYDATGRKLASKDLGSHGFSYDAMGIVGSRIVYTHSGSRRVYAWDPRTGVETLLAVSKRTIENFVVTEHAAVWTESVDARHFAIVRLDIPNR